MRARRIDAATLAVACHRQSHRPLSHSGQKNRHSGQNRHGGQKNTECAIWNDRNDTMKAYEAIAQSLIAEGVTDFFGLMGDGNMWLWGALCRNPAVKPYNARHESMAVSMADGYTRTTGKVGVAMVTCGPGLTQCGTSLIAAYRGKTPLVVIAGEIQPGAKNKTQSMDQRRFAEASSARFFTVTSLDNMAEEIAEAFYAARTGRGAGRAQPADAPAGRRPRLGLRLSSLHAVPAAAHGNPQPRPAGAGDREADRGGTSGHHRRPRRHAPPMRRRKSSNWPTASARCWQRRCKAKAISPAIRGTSASPARSPRPRRSNCWPTPTSCSASARSLATTPPKAACCFPSAEVARIDIKPMPEEIGVIPGLYVQGDGRKAVAAINEALEARQVRKEGFRNRRDEGGARCAAAPVRTAEGWPRSPRAGRQSRRRRCPRVRC